MPARDPQSPLPVDLPPRKPSKALKKAKSGLLQHAAFSAVLALFFIGFNAAFTRDILWFPWPVAALIIIWLVHLQRYSSKAKDLNLDISVLMDEEEDDLLGGPRRSGNGLETDEAEFEFEPKEEQQSYDRARSSRRRQRDWLD